VACGGSVHATAGPDASGSTNAPDASADSTVNFGADADADDGAPPGDAADLQDATFLVPPADAEAGLPYCNSLACLVPTGCTTTLSGTVYDPAGRTPLYNAVVFVPTDPNGTLSPIATGAKSCTSCGVSIGGYVAVAATDVTGHFTITGVPATTHVDPPRSGGRSLYAAFSCSLYFNSNSSGLT
jgi:hypothetical protein